MNGNSMPVNRHVVDQLADTREQIKELRKAEAACVSQISELMGDNDSLGGNQYIAKQKMHTRKGSVDIVRMEADGIDVDAYRKPDTVVFQIRTEERAVEVAE